LTWRFILLQSGPPIAPTTPETYDFTMHEGRFALEMLLNHHGFVLQGVV